MRRLLAVTSAAVLVLVACGEDSEPAATPPDTTRPEAPFEPIPTEPGESEDPAPELVEPRPGMVDVRPHAFESAAPIDGGSVLAVRYWAGIEPCDVLDRVDVEETATDVTVTLRIGHAPEAGEVACILIAQRYETRVPLEQPLGDRTVVDGARGIAAGADSLAAHLGSVTPNP